MVKTKYTPDWTDLRNISIPDTKIDATDPNNLSNRVLDERESRKRWLAHARMVGCEREMLIIFAKYDKLLRNCTDDKERADIAKLGVLEVYSLLPRGGELYVDGQLIYSDKKEIK
jgi:hypothetical protein